MKIKTQITFLILILLGELATLAIYPVFRSWGLVLLETPDVMIVRSVPKPTLQTTNAHKGTVVVRGVHTSDAQVLQVLRGATNTGAIQIQSTLLLDSGGDYLVLGTRTNGICYAMPSYQLISLGTNFPLGLLAQKHFEEQLQSVFDYRLKMLEREAKTNVINPDSEIIWVREGANGKFTDEQIELLRSLTNGTFVPHPLEQNLTNGSIPQK